MAFLVCLLFRESIGVAITKSFVIFVRKFFVLSHTVLTPFFVQYVTKSWGGAWERIPPYMVST